MWVEVISGALGLAAGNALGSAPGNVRNLAPLRRSGGPFAHWDLLSPSTLWDKSAMFSGEKGISATTRFCAVYGHPIKHSASPAMQNAGMAALNLPWRYLAFEVVPDDLSAAILGAGAMRFIGLNLTVPHKLLAVDMVNDLDASARFWGADNTVRFEARTAADGEWIPLRDVPVDEVVETRSVGFNTDADAIIQAVREDLEFEPLGGKVLLLGAGGAGRVAALRLAAEGVGRLWLVNRTTAKAEAVAVDIHQRFPGTHVTVGYPDEPVDLVLNATSLGLKPEDALPLDVEMFDLKHARFAYDMVYRPAETPFLKLAGEAGLKTANGLGMLLYQGAKALEIWSGQAAPVDVMRKALKKAIYG
jgi:shikimate dehydrogenase